MPHDGISRLAAIAVVLTLLLGRDVARAGVDLTGSTISVSSESPLEGERVEFIVTLKNSGDAPAEFTQISVNWPLMGYLVDVAGLDEPTVDHAARNVSASVSVPAGGERSFRLQVLAPRDSGGDSLSVSVHIAHYPSQTEMWEHKTVTVETRPSTSGVPIGGYRLTAAGIGVVAWLVVSLALWGGLWAWGRPGSGRALAGPGRTVAALMIPIGFWLVFAQMAWRDYRTLTAWVQTEGTIVGRRTIVQSTGNSTPSTGASRSSSGSTTFSPEFALRYLVDGTEIYSTGYDSGSSLRIGGRVRREQEMRDWTAGTVIPIWYDPDNPRDVIVRRGFGGAYLFALFPVPVFWFGIVCLRRLLAGAARKT